MLAFAVPIAAVLAAIAVFAAATEAVVARAERPSVPFVSVVTAKMVPVWLAVLVPSPAITT